MLVRKTNSSCPYHVRSARSASLSASGSNRDQQRKVSKGGNYFVLRSPEGAFCQNKQINKQPTNDARASNKPNGRGQSCTSINPLGRVPARPVINWINDVTLGSEVDDGVDGVDDR
ncbi:hypothetical protein MCOR16_001092 [Pyricularia oryzae]|nr:hypothetical protein MCOR15_002718 [Pyricularia oryzae]KAI6540087.1 hypothetical protein MCOR16_001092 [Pyricularia oryzae]